MNEAISMQFQPSSGFVDVTKERDETLEEICWRYCNCGYVLPHVRLREHSLICRYRMVFEAMEREVNR